MTNRFRKLLSILCAVMMLQSYVPVTFAESGTETIPETQPALEIIQEGQENSTAAVETETGNTENPETGANEPTESTESTPEGSTENQNGTPEAVETHEEEQSASNESDSSLNQGTVSETDSSAPVNDSAKQGEVEQVSAENDSITADNQILDTVMKDSHPDEPTGEVAASDADQSLTSDAALTNKENPNSEKPVTEPAASSDNEQTPTTGEQTTDAPDPAQQEADPTDSSAEPADTPTENSTQTDPTFPGTTDNPEGTTEPGEIPTPEGNPEPVESQTPAETTDPAQTNTPDATTVPEEVTNPDGTTQPAEITDPEGTQVPEGTVIPDQTSDPGETTDPAGTEDAENTVNPDATTEPENIANPEGTTEPEITTDPEETPEAEPTSELEENNTDDLIIYLTNEEGLPRGTSGALSAGESKEITLESHRSLIARIRLRVSPDLMQDETEIPEDWRPSVSFNGHPVTLEQPEEPEEETTEEAAEDSTEQVFFFDEYVEENATYPIVISTDRTMDFSISVKPRPAEETEAESTEQPTEAPTEEQTEEPTEVPAEEQIEEPTEAPTEEQTEEPTEVPAEEQTEAPTEAPAEEQTEEPTEAPTEEQTEEPTEVPTEEQTEEPTEVPATDTTEKPTAVPTEEVTAVPTEIPTEEPTAVPTEEPTAEPTEEPTVEPTEEPTATPEPETVYMEAGSFTTLENNTFVTVTFGDHVFPVGTKMKVREVTYSSESAELKQLTDDLINDDWNESTDYFRAFDITFFNAEGEEIEPEAPISVEFYLRASVEVNEDSILKVIHVDNNSNATEVSAATQTSSSDESKVNTISFDSGEFSYYVFAVQTRTYKTISDQGNSYEVTITYGEDTQLPSEGTEVKVHEILEGTEEYESYRQMVSEQLNHENVMFSGLYDIKILANGEVISPEKNVSVSLKLLDENAIPQDADIHVFHFEEDNNTVTPKEVNASVVYNTVVFSTDGFSAYAIAYTVDYTYNDVTFHMQGGTSMYLSEILQQIGLEDVGEITKVEFTDPELLKITKTENDWLVESLQPFTSDEYIIVSTLSKGYYKILVIDAQYLTDIATLNTSARVNGSELTGATTVAPNDNLKISLSFAEEVMKKFDRNGPLMYKLPDGLMPGETSGIIIPSDSSLAEIYSINYTVFQDGTVVFNWDVKPGKKQEFEELEGLFITLDIEATVSAEKDQTIYIGGGSLVVKDEHDLGVTKYGTYDKEANQMVYTVVVSSTGNNPGPITVTDIISGTALTLRDQSATIDYGINSDNISFSYDIDNGKMVAIIPDGLSGGQNVSFKYRADVNLDVLKQEGADSNKQYGSITTTKNEVTVEGQGTDDNSDNNYSTSHVDHSISFSSVSKTGENGIIEEGNRIINWQITANTENKAGITYIKDSMKNGSDKMTYTGNGITVQVFKDGQKEVSIPVPWSTLNVNENSKSWSYSIPSQYQTSEYSFVVDYSTAVNVEDAISNIDVSNEAETDYGRSGNTVGAEPGPGNKLTFSKEAKEVDIPNKTISWDIRFDVPAKGLNSAVITDYLPTTGQYGGSLGYYYDGYSGITCENLLPGESIDILENKELIGEKSVTTSVVFTFKRLNNEGETIDGLNPSDEPRTVIIHLTTTINEEWINSTPDESNAYLYLNHTNRAVLNANNTIQIEDSDTVKIDNTEPSIAKSGNKFKDLGYAENHIRYQATKQVPCYSYEIFLYNLDDSSFNEANSLVVRDVFNSYLKYYTISDEANGNGGYLVSNDGNIIENPGETNAQYGSYHQHLYWIDEKNTPHNLLIPDQYVELNDNTVTFTIPKEVLPKDKDGKLFNQYSVKYILFVKNPEELEQMKKDAIAAGGTLKLNNSVIVADKMTGGVDISYEVPIASKSYEVLSSTEAKYKFTIDINPNSEHFGTGKTLTVKDSYTNLSVDYDSIESDPADALLNVDHSGNVITYIVKNGTHVKLHYNAYAVSNGAFSNTVEINGQDDTANGNADITSRGSTGANNLRLTIQKHVKGNMLEVLSGVKFKLYKYDENNTETHYGDEVKPETGEFWITDDKGQIKLSLPKLTDADGHYLSHTDKYIIHEVEPLPGFEPIPHDYVFTIDKATINYGSYIYIDNDTMPIANTPVEENELTISVVKSFDSATTDLPNVTIRLYEKDSRLADKSDTDREVASIELPIVDAETGNTIYAYDFKNLPADKAYYIEEDPIAGYIATYSNNNQLGLDHSGTISVTNTKQKITIEKKWVGGTPDSLRGLNINLLKDGVFYKTYTIIPKDGEWKIEIDDLEFPGVYTVEEPVIQGYALDSIVYTQGENAVSGLSSTGSAVITNKKDDTPPSSDTTSLQVEKKWYESDGETEISNSSTIETLSAQIELERFRSELTGTVLHFFNGENQKYAEDVVASNNSEGITLTFYYTQQQYDSIIIKDLNGKEVFRKNPGYEDFSSNNPPYAISFIFTPEEDSEYNVYVNEYPQYHNVFTDGSVTVSPKAEGSNYVIDPTFQSKYSGKKMSTLNYYNSFRDSFINLPLSGKDDEGKNYSYQYGVREVKASDGFILASYSSGFSDVENAEGTSNPSSVVLVNNKKNDDEKTQISITKKWADNNDQDGKRSGVKATVTLKKTVEGATTDVETVEVGTTAGWSKTWTNLPIKESGKDIQYSVVETLKTANGYTSDTTTAANVDNGGSKEITNSYTPGTVDVNITKTWSDDNDKLHLRPSSDQYKNMVHLYVNGVIDTIKTPTVYDNGDNTYTVTFSNLDEKSNGVAIEYTVKEDAIQDYIDMSDIIIGDEGKITNIAIEWPTFEKNIKDINDSTDSNYTGWQDSADYDIGDDVPYKLTATLANNVTDYKTYHITFHDKLENTLSFNNDVTVEVIAADGTVFATVPTPVYTHKTADDSFAVTLSWGDGTSKITDAKLNQATVNVYFTAKLLDSANLGQQGNINEAYLEYSNNPSLDNGGTPGRDETGKTDHDVVIAFTYLVEINKVDAEHKELAGAEFRLEKYIKATDDWSVIAKDAQLSTASKFAFKGLDDGQYRLTETKVPSGYKGVDPIEFTVTADHDVVWDVTNDSTRTSVLKTLTGKVDSGEIMLTKQDASSGKIAGEVVNKQVDKPEFNKKIQDINDSEGESSRTDWQDSADYDIGDLVPYRLQATLPDDVTDYCKYHITFHDQLENTLKFNEITGVTITRNGKTTTLNDTAYKFEKTDDQNFTVKVVWGGEMKDGKYTRITDAELNGAVVNVYFNAELLSNANLGKKGNINTAWLSYSNNPNLVAAGDVHADEESPKDSNGEKPSDEEGETEKDSVIAFTYKVDISKVDADNKALAGAAFKLEKVKAGGNEVIGTFDAVVAGNVFTFKGLDDGEYILTETKAPAGYKAIAPIRFTVKAEHNPEWKVEDGADRETILTTLSGNVTTGELELAADEAMAGLTGDVQNKPAETPTFEKKIMDTNDSTGEKSGWQDSADYDIGDAVPYRLTAKLADNVTDYYKYRITFHDTMEESLDPIHDTIGVSVNGKKAEETGAKVTTTVGAHGFDVTLTWEAEKAGGKYTGKLNDATLNGGNVEVLFSATLNRDAVLGAKGNVNTARLEYSNNPNLLQEGENGYKPGEDTPNEETEETPNDSVIVFTYKTVINKMDNEGKALDGAAFKLEKVDTDGQVIGSYASTVSGNQFTFTGLDDGLYMLTETKAPAGFETIEPIRFTVTADHNVEWKVEEKVDRGTILKKLTGNVTTGELTLTGNEGLTGDVKNTPEKTEASVQKLWDDAENQDGKRPESLNVQLLADGKTVSTVTLSKANEWTAKVEDLPKYADGKEITYSWTEAEEPEGYELTGNATSGTVTTLTNTHKPEMTRLTVTKVWDDAEDQDGKRPTHLSVVLQADGEEIGTAVLSAGNNWTATSNELPVYKAGKEIVYSWTEGEMSEGYLLTGTTVDGKITSLTNTYQPETVSVSIVKVWDDAENQDGKRPESLSAVLQADGTAVETVVLSEENAWTATVEELPAYSEGKPIVYSWTEGEVPEGYELTGTAENGMITVLTNTYVPEVVSSAVSKVWEDEDNADGLRPGSITVTLSRTVGEKTEEVGTYTLNEANAWTTTVEELPKYVAGEVAAYSWSEAAVEGYTSAAAESAEGTVFTNTHKAEKTSASVLKVWDDENNREGKRPLSITVELTADGAGTGKFVTLSNGNGWSGSIQDLPARKNGKEITYGWSEAAVDGYTFAGASTTGTITILTNKRVPEKTSVSVRKEWDDNNNGLGKRPDSVTVMLFADGVATGETARLSAGNGWAHTWDDLDVYRKGTGVTGEAVRISYTVEELDVPEGYTRTITGGADGGFVITNMLERGSLRIEKTFEIEKKEEEEQEEELTSVPVQKIWVDNDNKDGNRPASVTVHLHADGAEIGTVLLSDGNGWGYTFTELSLRNENGRRIQYTVSEDSVDMYVSQVSGTTIINTYQPVTRSVSVRKVWNDNNNEAGLRPKSIRMTLSDGTRVVLKEGNNWTAVVTNLPAIVNGEEVAYTWTEQEVNGYHQTGITTNGDATVVTNAPVGIPKIPEGYKKPTLPKDEFVIFEEYDTALGMELMINHVGDCFD